MSVYLSLPARYTLIVGDTFELFRRSVVMASNPYAYNWRVECEKGAIFTRKYVYTPSPEDVGTHLMTMTLEDDSGTVLDRKVVKLEVLPPPVQPSRPIHMTFVGASASANGEWASEVARRLTGDDPAACEGAAGAPVGWGLKDIHFWGSVQGRHGAFLEGYGGWSFKSYTTDHESKRFWWGKPSITLLPQDQHARYRDEAGVLWCLETIGDAECKLISRGSRLGLPPQGRLSWESGGESHSDFTFNEPRRASGNPFWNEETGRLDFAHWANRLGAPGLDILCVNLGWNSTLTPREEYMEDVRRFIRGVHEAFPACRIILMGIHMPSQDGFGQNYGCMWNYRDKMDYVSELDRRYEQIEQEFDFVSFHSLAGQFDTEYGYPQVEEAPNARSSVRLLRQSNGVHPTMEGYMQFADAVTRAVVGELAKL